MVVLRNTAEMLRRRGIHVDESIDRQPSGEGYDLAHIFNTNPANTMLPQVQSIKRSGIPVVSTTIYHQVDFQFWANNSIVTIFREDRPEAELQQLLEILRNRTLELKLAENCVITAHQAIHEVDLWGRQRALLQLIDFMMPSSYLELSHIAKRLHVSQTPFRIVRFGTDVSFGDADPEPFIKKFGLRDFILCVGRFDGAKNQLMLLHAMRNVDLPLVLIGNMMDPTYTELCRRVAGPRAMMIPYLELELLKSAYAAARVHVLPSFIDTCGLVTMEAALADCNVVVSCTGNELEYFRDLAYYCDPVDGDSIRDSVLRAYSNYDRDAERRESLRRLIRDEYDREKVIEDVIGVYREVCPNVPK